MNEPLQTIKALNKAQEILNELEALMQQRNALECAYREAVKPVDAKISAARCALAMAMELAVNAGAPES